VLLSGDHAAIRCWRLSQAVQRTLQRRPDLLVGVELPPDVRRILAELQAAGAAEV
jgi:tRNA (guanine37-N1)-methyltransferase